jgi:hypothetical protein
VDQVDNLLFGRCCCYRFGQVVGQACNLPFQERAVAIPEKGRLKTCPTISAFERLWHCSTKNEARLLGKFSRQAFRLLSC